MDNVPSQHLHRAQQVRIFSSWYSNMAVAATILLPMTAAMAREYTLPEEEILERAQKRFPQPPATKTLFCNFNPIHKDVDMHGLWMLECLYTAVMCIFANMVLGKKKPNSVYYARFVAVAVHEYMPTAHLHDRPLRDIMWNLESVNVHPTVSATDVIASVLHIIMQVCLDIGMPVEIIDNISEMRRADARSASTCIVPTECHCNKCRPVSLRCEDYVAYHHARANRIKDEIPQPMFIVRATETTIDPV